MARSLLLLLVLAACSGKTPSQVTNPDPACQPAACQLGADETCGACFAQLGRCCYDDATIGGQAGALAASCESRQDCRRCCDECASRSCDDIRRNNDCANGMR